MSGKEVHLIIELCSRGAIKILFASFEMSWILSATEIHSSNLIIVETCINNDESGEVENLKSM